MNERKKKYVKNRREKIIEIDGDIIVAVDSGDLLYLFICIWSYLKQLTKKRRKSQMNEKGFQIAMADSDEKGRDWFAAKFVFLIEKRCILLTLGGYHIHI